MHWAGHLTEAERDAFIAAFYEDIANGSLLISSVRADHIFTSEPIISALQARRVIKKRPGPLDALLVACALDCDLTDVVLVSSDVALHAVAQQFGITTFAPEHASRACVAASQDDKDVCTSLSR